MFCHITENWRGRPLRSPGVIIDLIGSTTMKAGLRIVAELDCGTYDTGIKVSDEELAAVRIKRDEFHGEVELHDLTETPMKSVSLFLPSS